MKIGRRMNECPSQQNKNVVIIFLFFFFFLLLSKLSNSSPAQGKQRNEMMMRKPLCILLAFAVSLTRRSVVSPFLFAPPPVRAPASASKVATVEGHPGLGCDPRLLHCGKLFAANGAELTTRRPPQGISLRIFFDAAWRLNKLSLPFLFW